MEEANLAVAAFLTGLIWTIQLVHYPLFDRVGQEAWRTYEAAHQRAITPLVLPVMLANVGIAAALVLDEATGLTVANAALAGTIFAATGLYYGPLHGRLAQGWDPVLHRRLVVLNWLRTAAWSAQTAVALALL
jgi:hypothetical protein